MIVRCEAMYGAVNSRAGRRSRAGAGTSGARSSAAPARARRAARGRGRRRASSARAEARTTARRSGFRRGRAGGSRPRARRSSAQPTVDEHEPRQGDEGHRAAGARDGLGDEEGDEGAVLSTARNIVRPSVFVKLTRCRRSPTPTGRRRRQIVAGARRAFARFGYDGATVDVLEREIGLSRGAIFNYFPTKLDSSSPWRRRTRAGCSRSGSRRATARRPPRRRGRPRVARRVPRRVADAAHRPGAARAVANAEPGRAGALEAALPAAAGGGRDPRRTCRWRRWGASSGVVFDGLAVQQAARGAPIDVDGTIELLRSALAPK